MARNKDASGTIEGGCSKAASTESSIWSRRSFLLKPRPINPAKPARRTQDGLVLPVPCTPTHRSNDPAAPTSTRKVSASFSTDCPASGHPTIACSAVTASTKRHHPDPLGSNPVHESSGFSASQSIGNMNIPNTPIMSKLPRSSHTYGNLRMLPMEHKAPPSRQTAALAYIDNAKVQHTRNRENIPPSVPIIGVNKRKKSPDKSPVRSQTLGALPKPPPLKKVRTGREMPTSRTRNIFSNLTSSLSRTSLGSFTSNDSRRVSTSSQRTTRKGSASYMNPPVSSSNSSRAFVKVEEPDPYKIYTAQSSAYWTGRFMSLQDRFRSETLTPENLATLVQAHADHSLVSVVRPSLASSATTSCIAPPPPPPPSGLDFTRRAVTNKFMIVGSNKTLPQRLPQLRHQERSPTPQPQRQSQQQQQQPNPSAKSSAVPKTSCAPATATATATATTTTTTTTATATSSSKSDSPAAAALMNEDERCRRVFRHLDAQCATSEARTSLQQWQETYARQTGKENLLPEGGSMREKLTRERTWVGRLLSGSGSGRVRSGGWEPAW